MRCPQVLKTPVGRRAALARAQTGPEGVEVGCFARGKVVGRAPTGVLSPSQSVILTVPPRKVINPLPRSCLRVRLTCTGVRPSASASSLLVSLEV